MRAIDLAEPNTTVGGVTDSRSMVVNTLLTKHIRSAHGMKTPKGTAPRAMAKLHKALHARGGAGHTHKGGSYSNPTQQSFDLSTLTTKARKALPKSAFAYVDKDGKGHFPIYDATHVRNALARIAQGAQYGDKAKKKVLAAAKRMGIGQAKNMSNGSRPSISLADSASYDLDTSKAAPSKLAALRQAVKVAKSPDPALVARARALGCVFDDDGDDWDDLVEWATGKADSDDRDMSNPFASPANALGRVLGVNLSRYLSADPTPVTRALNLARSSGPKMSPYRPKGAERQRVVEHLRASRALRRSGRAKQAASIDSALLASATNRARVMPDGSRRAHTAQEAKIGLMVLSRQSLVKGSGIADGKVTQPRPGTANQAKAKGPQVPTERGGRPQQAKGTTPTPTVAGKPGRLAAVPQGAGATAPSPQIPKAKPGQYPREGVK